MRENYNIEAKHRGVSPLIFCARKITKKPIYKLTAKTSNNKTAVYHVLIDKIKEPIFLKYIKENKTANIEDLGKVLYSYFYNSI